MKIKLIQAEDLKNKLKKEKPILIDVRELDEWQAGHIAEATHIPLGQIAHRIQEACKNNDTPIFLYCQRGRRSEQAALVLLSLGFTNITHLEGGFQEWIDSGCPCQATQK